MNEISNTLRQSKVKGRRRNRFYKLKEMGWNRCTVQAFHSLRFLKIWRHFLPGPFWWKEKKILAIESHKGHPHLQCSSAPEPRTQISVARRDRWSRKREASNLMIKSFILVYPFKNSSLFSGQVSAHTHTIKKLRSLVTE